MCHWFEYNFNFSCGILIHTKTSSLFDKSYSHQDSAIFFVVFTEPFGNNKSFKYAYHIQLIHSKQQQKLSKSQWDKNRSSTTTNITTGLLNMSSPFAMGHWRIVPISPYCVMGHLTTVFISLKERKHRCWTQW